jgi:curved DNA-binding protein CbpA
MADDHYQTLQVPPSATSEEIRAAYLRLVLAHHPDLHAADPDATVRFKRIQRAYEVLSSRLSRTRYNRGRRAVLDPPFVATPLRGVQSFPSSRSRPSRSRRSDAVLERIGRPLVVAVSLLAVTLCLGFLGRDTIVRTLRSVADAVNPHTGESLRFPTFDSSLAFNQDGSWGDSLSGLDLISDFRRDSSPQGSQSFLQWHWSTLSPSLTQLAADLSSPREPSTIYLPSGSLYESNAGFNQARTEVPWHDPAASWSWESNAVANSATQSLPSALTEDVLAVLERDLPNRSAESDSFAYAPHQFASVSTSLRSARLSCVELPELSFANGLSPRLQRALDAGTAAEQLAHAPLPAPSSRASSAIDQWLQEKRLDGGAPPALRREPSWSESGLLREESRTWSTAASSTAASLEPWKSAPQNQDAIAPSGPAGNVGLGRGQVIDPLSPGMVRSTPAAPPLKKRPQLEGLATAKPAPLPESRSGSKPLPLADSIFARTTAKDGNLTGSYLSKVLTQQPAPQANLLGTTTRIPPANFRPLPELDSPGTQPAPWRSSPEIPLARRGGQGETPSTSQPRLPAGFTTAKAAREAGTDQRAVSSAMGQTDFRRSQQKYGKVDRNIYGSQVRSGAPLTSLGATLEGVRSSQSRIPVATEPSWQRAD